MAFKANPVRVGVIKLVLQIISLFILVKFQDKMYFRLHLFVKYTVEYIHHFVIHDVLYSVRHLMNGWDQEET